MSSQPPNWERVQEIYHQALALPPSERSTFVTKVCAGDTELLREVKAYVEADNLSDHFLQTPVFKLDFETSSLVGTTVDDHYDVERELPGGGMGQVYLARDRQLSRLVVIKTLRQASLKDPDALKRFQREVKALTLIDHPNVVSVYGAGKLADGQPYLVMQYIDGLTLRSQIGDKRIEVERVASILKGMGTALSQIHDKGILHLDLKPENIMIQVFSDGTELVKIVDFGIAKIKDSLADTGTINTVPIGTLAYMSPEQLQEGAKVTAASDIYSLAIVACEMITGKRPFDGAKELRVTPPELPSGLSKAARKILASALSSDPAARYQSAKEFGDDLARALLLEKSHDKAPVSWWQRMNRPAAIVGALIIFSLVSYGIYRKFIEPIDDSPGSSRGFDYSLMVQRMRDGNEYDDAYKSNGNDIFDNGDKFQLNIHSLESGYLYIFNEAQPEPGKLSFRMLYPNRETNNASSALGANQTVSTERITFRGPAGTENFWIVWSASPVNELESAKTAALSHAQGGLTDQHLTSVRAFLTNQAKGDVRRVTDSQKVTVRKKSNIVLTYAQFKHR